MAYNINILSFGYIICNFQYIHPQIAKNPHQICISYFKKVYSITQYSCINNDPQTHYVGWQMSAFSKNVNHNIDSPLLDKMNFNVPLYNT